MAIYLTMFAYVGFLGFVIQEYYKKNELKTKYNSKIPFIGALVVMTLPVVFIGLRSSFGDTHAYISDFVELNVDISSLWQNREEIKGFGFTIYMYIIKRFISTDPQVFLMITAIIQGLAVVKLYYRYSTNFTYSMLLFFFSMGFTNMMNGMRQFLAFSLLALFSDFLFERKTIPFLIVALLAFTIHSSIIIWVPIYFVVQGKPWNLKVLLSIVVIIVVISSLDSFTEVLSESLEGTTYDGYTNQFEKDDGSNIMHTLIALVPALLSLWKRKEIEQVNNPISYVLVNCSVITVLVSVMANLTSGILVGRLTSYFTPFSYLLLPWIFDNVIEEKDRRLVRAVCLIAYGLYALYYMTSQGITYESSYLGIFM